MHSMSHSSSCCRLVSTAWSTSRIAAGWQPHLGVRAHIEAHGVQQVLCVDTLALALQRVGLHEGGQLWIGHDVLVLLRLAQPVQLRCSSKPRSGFCSSKQAQAHRAGRAVPAEECSLGGFTVCAGTEQGPWNQLVHCAACSTARRTGEPAGQRTLPVASALYSAREVQRLPDCELCHVLVILGDVCTSRGRQWPAWSLLQSLSCQGSSQRSVKQQERSKQSRRTCTRALWDELLEAPAIVGDLPCPLRGTYVSAALLAWSRCPSCLAAGRPEASSP